jgi:hypothetical protein
MSYLIYSLVAFACFLCGLLSWKARDIYPLAGKIIVGLVIALGLFFLFGTLVFVSHSFRRLFSYPVQFWTIVSLPHIVFYTIYFVGGIIFVEWLKTKRGFYLAINIVMLIGITIGFYSLFMVDNHILNSYPLQSGYQLQSSGYSCTAACVVNLAFDFHISISEQDAADRMQLIETGASIAQIGYLLEKLGFKFDETTTSDLNDIRFPAIISVHFMGTPDTHVVYLKERKNSSFLIVDPSRGVETYRNTNWFNENWNGLGIHNISK